MRTDLFDFTLPDERIALAPAAPRDSARLLVVGAPGKEDTAPFDDRVVSDLPELLRAGDALVFNDTRVIPAALSGLRHRGDSRRKVSFNLHRRVDESRWQAFARPARHLAVGDRVQFGGDGTLCYGAVLNATVAKKGPAGEVTLAFDLHGVVLDEAINAHGQMPLPPYIAAKRDVGPADTASYQTIYARRDGAVAAPTAGLHFTDRLMAALDAKGIWRHFLTLHVGAGTFLPVKTEDTDDHKMHSEWGQLTQQVADSLNDVRGRGGRIVAVGTTALRLLETAADERGLIAPFSGETDIFITPGYRFRAVDLLWTNFHLPRSSLFMLVSAFAGLARMKAAYQHAIAARYRFYSYGDACLLHPDPTARMERFS